MRSSCSRETPWLKGDNAAENAEIGFVIDTTYELAVVPVVRK